MTDMTSSASSSDEYLSALFDGQVEGPTGSAETENLGSSPDLETTWISYQVLGQVMRGEPDDSIAAQSFLASFERRLVQEASIQVPAPIEAAVAPSSAPARVARASETVRIVSDSIRKWKLVAAFIASALSGALGLGLLQQTAMVQVADVSQPAPVTSQVTDGPAMLAVESNEPTVMIRDPALDALLAAHQLQGGHSALQMPSGFLRNATFERPAK